MTVMVWGRVLYACTLDEEDSEKVRQECDERPEKDAGDIVWELYDKGEIQLFKDSIESDFMADEIVDVEDDEDD